MTAVLQNSVYDMKEPPFKLALLPICFFKERGFFFSPPLSAPLDSAFHQGNRCATIQGSVSSEHKDLSLLSGKAKKKGDVLLDESLFKRGVVTFRRSYL